jgi:hypothetical protein
LAFSGLRCVLAYVIVPVAKPVLGLSGGASGAVLGALRVLAIVSSTRALVRGLRHDKPAMTLLGAALLSFNLLGIVIASGT